MKPSANRSFTFWFVCFICLTALLIFQSSFLSSILKPSFVPYILWSPLLFFFLYKSFLHSFILLFFASILSSVFLSLSVTALFFIYLFFFISVIAIKQFFISKSFIFFVNLVFVFSFLFPCLVEGAYDLLLFKLSLSDVLFYFYKSFTTAVFAGFLFPVLKRYFSISEGV